MMNTHHYVEMSLQVRAGIKRILFIHLCLQATDHKCSVSPCSILSDSSDDMGDWGVIARVTHYG